MSCEIGSAVSGGTSIKCSKQIVEWDDGRTVWRVCKAHYNRAAKRLGRRLLGEEPEEKKP